MNILVIDDHPLFSRGLELLLNTLDKNYICHCAQTLADALALYDVMHIDLILLDLYLNQEHWSANLAQLQKAYKNVPVAIISSNDDPRTIHAVIGKNIHGFIPKSSTPQIFKAAIDLIMAGGIFIPAQLTLGTSALEDASKQAAIYKMSKRQVEVLKYAADGLPNKLIAKKLHLAESTIKSHLSIIYRTLNVKNKTQAIRLCHELDMFGTYKH